MRSRVFGPPALAVVAAMSLLAQAGQVAAQPPLEALPSILQLDLSQHPAWRAYKDAAAESHADAAQEAARVNQLNAMTTPQRLEALRGELKARAAAFDRQAAATTAFYEALSPDQRRIFDGVTALPPPPSPLPRTQRQAEAPSGPGLRTPPTGTPLPPPAP